MKTALRAALLALIVLLAACATTGQTFDSSVVQGFKTGQTTQADVRAKLGEPQIKTSGEDGPGSSTWTYASGTTPLVAVPFAHPKTKEHSVALTFDARGVLQHVDERESNF